MNIKIIKSFALLLAIGFAGCTQKRDATLEQALAKSKNNRIELEKALNHFENEQQEAMAFLVKNMPERDLLSLTADFLIENVESAYLARQSYPWTASLDKEIFFNEVLPYASLNERRDRWRPDFLKRFGKYVQSSQTLEEAMWQVNNNILKELKVEYNTNRKKPDQSPYESMEQGMASCSGLSILLTNAFRAVGIPARVAGTPNWYNNSGNHNWVEVYIDGNWHFTEYYPSGKLDESWFLERAGKADSLNHEQWIYAASFKPTQLSFPLVWDSTIQYVFAQNVTNRYIGLYQKQNPATSETIKLQVILLKDKSCSLTGNNRVRKEVQLFEAGKSIDSGLTSGTEDDMNRFLTFSLEKNKEYQLQYLNAAGIITTQAIAKQTSDLQVILYHGQS